MGNPGAFRPDFAENSPKIPFFLYSRCFIKFPYSIEKCEINHI